MKKILLTSLALVFGFGLMAQRSVDWEVSEILSPTSLNTGMTGTTAINLHWVLKNNGPDSVEATDSIYFAMIITQVNNVYITSFPENINQISFFRTADKVMKTGDTVHFRRSLTTSLGVNNSGNIRFVAVSEVRKSNLTESVTANNIKIVNPMIWFNRQNNGVSVTSVSENMAIEFFGNPVANEINLALNVIDANNAVTLTLTDLSGKQLKTVSFDNKASLKLDVSEFANGNYILTVKNGALNYTNKVIILK